MSERGQVFRAEVIAIDANGKPVTAAVATDSLAIIARYVDDTWQPVHGIRLNVEIGDDDVIRFPPGFTFNPKVLKTLDALREP